MRKRDLFQVPLFLWETGIGNKEFLNIVCFSDTMYRLTIKYLLLIVVMASPFSLAAQSTGNRINHFIVVENLLKNDKLAIIATDSLEKPLEHINGTFQFSLNNFTYPLKFNDGVAVTPNQVEKSTFLFIKHQNEEGSHGQLYYILKRDAGLNPIKISWILLILIPAVLIFVVMLFRKFLTIAVIGLLIFLYFNYKQGLDLTTFFETLVHGIKGLF